MHWFSSLFYMETKFGRLRQQEKKWLTSIEIQFLEEQRNRQKEWKFLEHLEGYHKIFDNRNMIGNHTLHWTTRTCKTYKFMRLASRFKLKLVRHARDCIILTNWYQFSSVLIILNIQIDSYITQQNARSTTH
jgi:hypothetical protein